MGCYLEVISKYYVARILLFFAVELDVEVEKEEEEKWRDGLRNILSIALTLVNISPLFSVNGVLKVSVRKQYSYGQPSCGSNNNGLTNVSVEVYDNPACKVNPIQIGMTEGISYNAKAFFLN